MGKLQFYHTIDEKQAYFNTDTINNNVTYYKIDQAYELNDWYTKITATINNEDDNDGK